EAGERVVACDLPPERLAVEADAQHAVGNAERAGGGERHVEGDPFLTDAGEHSLPERTRDASGRRTTGAGGRRRGRSAARRGGGRRACRGPARGGGEARQG